jgi:hypothetical protein
LRQHGKLSHTELERCARHSTLNRIHCDTPDTPQAKQFRYRNDS